MVIPQKQKRACHKKAQKLLQLLFLIMIGIHEFSASD